MADALPCSNATDCCLCVCRKKAKVSAFFFSACIAAFRLGGTAEGEGMSLRFLDGAPALELSFLFRFPDGLAVLAEIISA